MKRVALLFALAGLAACSEARSQPASEALETRFAQAMHELQVGNLARAENHLREMLMYTDSPRVKLELARVLYLKGEYAQAKVLFQEISNRSDTPWRVVDNIGHFVRNIEERTGYIKFGVTIVSDSNPRNLAQKDFTIGGVLVTPTEAPKRVWGLRYSVRGWQPLASGVSGYANASYADFPGQEIDRFTADGGLLKNLSASGRVRGKAGVEFSTLDGAHLYHFPYVGVDAVVAESETSRATAELKLGRVSFPDARYLDATQTNAAFSVRRTLADTAALSISGSVEHGDTKERAYTYCGWDAGPGIDTFWPGSAFVIGARAAVGARKYAEVDPLFGQRRSDAKARFDVSIGNKSWRWRSSYVSLVGTIERSSSNIGFYSYRKANASIVVE